MAKMGLGNMDMLTFKRKFRWGISIDRITSTDMGTIAPNATSGYAKLLPPEKFGRPKISIKDFSVQHLSETVSYPDKVEWQPINLTLYDVHTNGNNIVYNWLSEFYNAERNSTKPTSLTIGEGKFIKTVNIFMYGGNGCILEEWILENAFPQEISWGDLDYSSSAYCTIDITLKYHRALFKSNNNN